MRSWIFSCSCHKEQISFKEQCGARNESGSVKPYSPL
nr:unnamed protein product [Callosobruchus chinensis]